MFYLSEYLENNRSEYYKWLNAITQQNDWMGWVEFFLTAIINQAQPNNTKAEAILTLHDKMKESIPACIYSQYATSILETLFKRPIFNSTQFMSDAKIETRGTTHKLLTKLTQAGIIHITKQAAGRTPTIYTFTDLVQIVL